MMERILKFAVLAVAVGLVGAVTPVKFRRFTGFSGTMLLLFYILSPLRTLNGFDVRSLDLELERQVSSNINGDSVLRMREKLLENYLMDLAEANGVECTVAVWLTEDLICEKACVELCGLTDANDLSAVLKLFSQNLNLSENEIEVGFESGAVN